MTKMVLALLVLLLVAACAPYPGPGGYAGWNCGGGYWGPSPASMNTNQYAGPMGYWR